VRVRHFFDGYKLGHGRRSIKSLAQGPRMTGRPSWSLKLIIDYNNDS